MSLRALLLAGLLAGAVEAAAGTRALVIAGLGGEVDYEQIFRRHAQTLHQALAQVADTAYLAVGVDARTENVQARLAQLAQEAGAGDRTVVLYVGHGSYDGEQFRFNVPGPDFTAGLLADWLDGIAGRQLVIVASSSSGAALGVLESQARAVVTATRSGEQSNATVFSRYLVEALDAGTADLDKDTDLSMQELFDYATASVAEHYASRNLMASEHPQIIGDAGGFVLATFSPPVAEIDPLLLPDLERRRVLEAAIEVLKLEKSGMLVDDYYSELQALLLELAVVEKRLADAGGGP